MGNGAALIQFFSERFGLIVLNFFNGQAAEAISDWRNFGVRHDEGKRKFITGNRGRAEPVDDLANEGCLRGTAVGEAFPGNSAW